MRNTFIISIGLALTALTGCAVEGEDLSATLASTTLATTGAATTETAEGDCEPGMRIGRCPKDFSLPNRDGDMVTLHEHRGSKVLVVGSAEY